MIDSAKEETSSMGSPGLLLRDAALGVEIAYVAALSTRPRIDRTVDQGRFPRTQRVGKRLLKRLRIRGVVDDSAKGFDQLFVAGFLHQDGWRGIGAAGAIDIVAAIDPAIVEDDRYDRQAVAADGFDF